MNVVLFTDVADSIGYGKYGGTYKIATEIRKAGYTCQVVDHMLFLGLDRLKKIVDKFVTQDTIMIGVSCTLNEVRDHLQNVIHFWGLSDNEFTELLAYIKTKGNAKIVIGGARIHEEIDFDYVDYAVIGKADNAVVSILEHLKYQTDLKHKQNNFTKIIYGDDYFYSQEEFKNSQIVFEEQDIILDNEWLPLEIARGCIFSCSFCQYDLIGKKMGDWTKTADSIYDEMMRNYKLFGTTSYMFTDELVNESVEKLQMLLSIVERLPFKLQYTAYARIDRIAKYPEMIELLQKTGAVSLAIGIESLNYNALLKLGKGPKPEIIKETLKKCKDAWGNNVIISCSFIVGLPEETEESIQQTFEYLLSDENPIDIFTVIPLGIRGFSRKGSTPKSKLEKNPEKYGMKIKINSWEWENTKSGSISRNRAMQLVKEFRALPKAKSRTIFYSSTFLGRILSLGFTTPEVTKIVNVMSSAETVKYRDIIQEKARSLKNEYYRRLMEV